MNQETLYERNGHTIKTIATGERKVYDSINKAKKESHKLQLSNGGLGLGSLVAI